MSKSKEQSFQTDIKYRTYRLRHFAQKYGWGLATDDGKTFVFVNNEDSMLKINYFDLNIETSLTHPKWGDTLLIRKGNFTQKIIESIFRNPRAHMPDQVKSEYISQNSKGSD